MSGLANARRRGPFSFDFEQPSPLTRARLPIGRHGLPRDFVEQNQRNRLMAGAVDSVGARGYLASTVAAIIKAAGVSRNTFYVYYADKRACFLDAYDIVVAWLEEEGQGAVAGIEDWAAGVKAVVESTLALLVADPGLSRLVTVEIFLAGPAAASRHRALVDRLSKPLRLGRAQKAPTSNALLTCQGERKFPTFGNENSPPL